MRLIPKFFILLFAALSAQNSAFGQENPQLDPLQYADLADLSIEAPIIVHATVKRAIKVKPDRAMSAPAGTQRYYVEAETNALIRGTGGIASTIRYVIDLPLDERARAPKIKRNSYLIFARPGSRDGEIQLVTNDAQLLWSADRDSRTRSLVREIVSRDAAPGIKRIASAFHVPGTIIGEGETQIFMETNSNDPVSISILSREGRSKQWAVSLGEIVDEAASAPVRNSLLWYRLACFLPRELPDDALDRQSASNAETARQDYRLVIRDLGRCSRSRSNP